MAKVEVTYKPPVEPEIERVTLELSKDEALALMALTGAVAVQDDATKHIYCSLSDALKVEFYENSFVAKVQNGRIRVTRRG